MQPNFNIVTAVYYSSRQDVHGGRGWTFHYYKPIIYAMTKLTTGTITIYHDSIQEPYITDFIKEHNITNIICKKIELNELPYHDEVYRLKKEAIDSKKIDLSEWSSNGVFHIVLLNKPWFMEQTAKDLNLSDEDPIVWIDAGLLHHGLFPENLGGVELFKFNLNNYYPTNKTSKFNLELGLKIQNATTSDKVLAFGNTQVSINRDWPENTYTEFPEIHIIGGMFGAKVSAIKQLSIKFYKFLELLIDNGGLTWEEGILSKLYLDNPDDFRISIFNTWYHDVPGVPNYFEGVFSGFENNPELRPVSFYRAYFNSLDKYGTTDGTTVSHASVTEPVTKTESVPYSIGITTFSKRFHELENLITKIRKYRPNVPILVAVNGNIDESLDDQYRAKVLNLAAQHSYVYPIMFLSARGYSKLANTLVIHSPTEHLICFNDDTDIEDENAFDALEQLLVNNKEELIYKMGADFSQAVFTKRGMIDIGWYDERYLSFGSEDLDLYDRYFKKYGRALPAYYHISGFKHLRASTVDDSFDDTNPKNPRYSAFNYDLYHSDKQSKEQYPYEQFYLDNKDKIKRTNI